MSLCLPQEMHLVLREKKLLIFNVSMVLLTVSTGLHFLGFVPLLTWLVSSKSVLF